MKQWREAFLAFRSILFVFLIPGSVAGYIPFLILQSSGDDIHPTASIGNSFAACLIVLGASVLLRCVWDFFAAGRGTLAPFDPPRQLVVRGLYRFTRNPMYNGVLAVLAGEAWLFHSASLWKYAAVVFFLFHVMVIAYEEPTLDSQFGESFRTYKRAVPRWGFTMRPFTVAVLCVCGLSISSARSTSSLRDGSIRISNRFTAPPRWAVLERQLLNENVPACRAFYQKYFDDRGYLQCVVRWGANDGPDDAFENFNRWPELHALGASDEIRQMFLKGHEGLLKQYTEARTTVVPIARDGMYYKEFIVQSDWMHHGEGLQLFNRMGLSVPDDPKYQDRVRTFAGFYMGEDPEAPNYDPVHKIIRSMQNGSRGPMLRPATPIDWVGDPIDVGEFNALHGESTFDQFLAHYKEYTDVVGDHFLNLVATTLPMDAYLVANEARYKKWIVEYMDAWLDRMKQNDGIIPSFVDLDGRIGGPERQWWKNAYGWGFSPINPVTGRREDRNRIPRALVGFNNALLVTGDRKYIDAWRTMIDAVNSHAREKDGRKEYPTMHGADGWYGWRDAPWNVGALEVWYWSQQPSDRERIGRNEWVQYLEGQNKSYPEQAIERDLRAVQQRVAAMRKDTTPANKRLADNMLDYNPAATESLVQLMWGGLLPGREGGLVNARLRYFDLDRKRAGLPEDVAALISQLGDARTTVTLVNLNQAQRRTVVVQGGAYGEHRLVSVKSGATTTQVDAPLLTVEIEPGCAATLELQMKRYANDPTIKHPWQRSEW